MEGASISIVSLNARSRDDEPAEISNSPPSTAHLPSRVDQKANERSSSPIVTRCDSPGGSQTFAKPFSSRIGRATLDSTSRT